ncbi:hypothetical protein [Flavimaricola marinus]|uniref:hypothetical protein n=1 Tax=Flavimaricola marinus TaxID=1819565 RepID=UPI001055EB69|nr:hypothetical protein [Flavimaricola marinus]
MPYSNDEATPIAQLIGSDGKSIVGLVYVWETSELAILWLNPKKTAAFVDPEIDPEMLAKGKATTPAELLVLLGGLPTLAKKSS